eukprot:11277032-Ditylum_brightwellii.AAC.1
MGHLGASLRHPGCACGAQTRIGRMKIKFCLYLRVETPLHLLGVLLQLGLDMVKAMGVCCVKGLGGTDIMQCLCWSIVVTLGGSPVNDGDGHIRQRDRDDFGAEVLGVAVLLAHDIGGRRLDGSIIC